MVVLGYKEVDSQTLAVRKRRSKETRTLDFEPFLAELKSGIDSRLIESENQNFIKVGFKLIRSSALIR